MTENETTRPFAEKQKPTDKMYADQKSGRLVDENGKPVYVGPDGEHGNEALRADRAMRQHGAGVPSDSELDSMMANTLRDASLSSQDRAQSYVKNIARLQGRNDDRTRG